MSKFEDCMAQYTDCLDNVIKVSYDAELLTKVAKGLGPSIYNADSSLVSGSDQSELDRVKENYLIKKLGLGDSADLDAAVKEVVGQFGSSNRNKYRAVFYYLLCVKFDKGSVYNK
jgi:Protein of unknown function (DUF2853)